MRILIAAQYKKILVFLILLMVIVFGGWLRISGIIENSFAFTYDVGRDMLALQQIVVAHKIPLIGQTTGLAGVFYGPWWYYILTLPFFILSGNPQLIALFLAIVGVLTILCAYFLGKKINGDFLGIIFSSLWSFSSVMIGLSAQIWNPNLIPLIILIFLYLLYKVTVGSTGKIFLFFGLVMSLIVDLEIVFGMLFLVSSFIYFIIFHNKKINKTNILYLFLGIFVIQLPKIFFEFRHNFLMTHKIVNTFITFSPSQNQRPFLETIFERVTTMTNNFSDTVANGNNEIGLFVLILCLIFLFISYKNAQKIEKVFVDISLTMVVTFLIGLTLFSQAIWSHYLVGMPVFYLLLIAQSINLFRKKINSVLIPVLFFIFLVWINLNPLQVYRNYQSKLWEGNAAVYRNQLAVLDYVYKDSKSREFNYLVYTPAVYDYPYQYLFSWYGKQKYGYSPSSKTSKLLYVILEPDYEIPTRLKDWLKIREGDGKVVREKLVKGGVLVQTRIR